MFNVSQKCLLLVQNGLILAQNIKMSKIVQNNLGQIIRYLFVSVYFGQIYLFAKIFINFF